MHKRHTSIERPRDVTQMEGRLNLAQRLRGSKSAWLALLTNSVSQTNR